MDQLTVYNLPPSPMLWDKVGIFYMTFCAVWTTLLIAGMLFCWFNRHTPVIKIRGLFLPFTAICSLHAYWIMAQITYPVGRALPMVLAYDIQYFVMGIWLPLGIALFHASNLRFLHIAKLQKQFTHPSLQRRMDSCNGAKTSFLCKIRNIRYSRRIMIFIGAGIVVQTLLAVGMWIACAKYHPTFGIPGTEMKSTNLMDQVVELGRGWEWWPSVLWQVLWTWVVAPILLWRAWSIHDTVGWRVQTIGCCLSSLHATPMFLIASYVPIFEKVNPYFSPSQWIHLSTMMFEIFTVFVPVFQIIRLRIIARRAADINNKWETSSQTSTLGSSTYDWKLSAINLSEKGKTFEQLNEELGDRLITMKALEHVLEENPAPLLEFSALNDFSGENIAFLNFLARWKIANGGATDFEHNLEAFNSALQIYTDFVSPEDAQFPLNLPSQKLKNLVRIFGKAARIVRGDAHINPATPFDEPLDHGESNIAINSVQYTGIIPGGFDLNVFDEVQDHIKYLVLTNTWPKFVAEMQSRRKSTDTGRSAVTDDSQATVKSQLSARLRSLLRTFV